QGVGHLLRGRVPLARLVQQALPAVPHALDRICRKCLLDETSERYPTAKEVADALDRFVRDDSTPARPVEQANVERPKPEHPKPAAPQARKHWAVSGAVAAVVLALVAGAWAVHAGKKATRAEHEVVAERHKTAAALEQVREEEEKTTAALEQAREQKKMI